MPYNLRQKGDAGEHRRHHCFGVTFMHTNSSSGVAPFAELSAETSPLREPSVVHSTRGRLRVHLPHWSRTGDQPIAAAVSSLPGVLDAAASPLTGNVLILFDPQQTSVPALLGALPALRAARTVGPSAAPVKETDLPVPLPGLPAGWPQAEGGTVIYVEGTRAVLYKALGWSSVGMAVVGAITPGIPTAPFVILAGYFFVRSSPESHRWLRGTRWFGPVLRDWELYHGVRRSLRNAALVLIGGSMALTALIGLPAPVAVTIVALQAVGLAIVLRIKVVEPAALQVVQPVPLAIERNGLGGLPA